MASTLRLADMKRFERKRDDGVPNGIRTRVRSVRGCCPRPLDDEDLVFGGGKRDRTADLLHAMQALSQLSYTPANCS